MFFTRDSNRRGNSTRNNGSRAGSGSSPSPINMSNRQARLSTKSHAPITDTEMKRLLNKWFNLNLEPHG